jgi:predicted transcriptional regulator
MTEVSKMIKAIDEGTTIETVTEAPTEEVKPQLTIKQAFKKDEIVCMVCNKGGFKTLKKHLSTAHQLTPGQYRKQFGIKSTQKLAAKSFSDARRQAAADRGMTAILAKARETRMANIAKKAAAATPVKSKAAKPATAKKAAPKAKK